MTLTKGRIDRAGTIHFYDASLAVWEDGTPPKGQSCGLDEKWEHQFKRDVFARIVQQLNRLGWTCIIPADMVTLYGRGFARDYRDCTKGDLQARLKISGRRIDLEMFQDVQNVSNPNGGRYDFDKAERMTYLQRLEMDRTRCRIRDYLCNVFTGYEFYPPKISSPNPDPLAYFNDSWDGEYEKRRGTHRFDRGADGWPSDAELASWRREDKDRTPLNHGDIRWLRDRKGRLLRGRVYGGINGMWMFVYGPGQRDFTRDSANRFFTYQPGMPRKLVDADVRRKRLEHELQKATNAMNFERAAVLRDILFPGNPALFVVWHKEHRAYHCAGFCGYTSDKSKAGRFTADEVRGWHHGPNKVIALTDEKVAA